MKPFGNDAAKPGINRRSFLGITGALAAGTITNALAAPASSGASAPRPAPGRRKLGTLEVSNVGIGMQNMGRKYDTTVPYRPNK